MVKLKSTCLEDTLKTAGSVKSFDFEFSSDLDCHPQSQDYILSVATDESQLQGKSISNESMCLERHFSSSELVAIGFYRPPEDTGIEIFFQTEHQATLLERYLDECKKFLSAPLEAVKRAFEGYNMPEAEKKIDLQNYGVNSLGIYLICQTMIGAPVAPITHLNLSNCSFDDVGCLAICELLQQSTVLTHLNLSGCPLGPKGGVVLAEGVEISQSLVDLNLSKCMLMDYGCFVIAKALHFHETCKLPGSSFQEYHFKHRSLPHARTRRSITHTRVLKRNPLIHTAIQQPGFIRVKRGLRPAIPSIHGLPYSSTNGAPGTMGAEPTDPYFPLQWYLKNTGQNGGKMRLDLNVQAAWDQGITGKNVTTAIMDDGVDYMHPDLKYNYNAEASYDFSSNDPYPYPRYTDDWFNSHGTRCAGEVAAARDNGICGVGVAYDSKIAGIRMLDQPYMTDLIEANSMGHEPHKIHIYSASWGPTDDGKTVDGPRNATMRAIVQGVNEGRNGLGNIYVWASGDGGEEDDCNCDGYAASMWTISINSAINDGQNAHYDESCSSTLASTFSNGAKDPNTGVATTDLYGKCTTTHSGTSAAAPEAAGVFALALEANPQLTWRDIQHLTVLTSKRNSLFDAKNRFHWTMNGVGLEFNHLFGFGVLDAGAMVTLAKQWHTVPPRYHCEAGSILEPHQVMSGRSLFLEIKTTACKGTDTEVNYLEHVQAVISANASRRGDLELFLTSPMGTRSMILSRRANDDDHRDGFTKWPFMTTHTWGEYPHGTWKLEARFNSQQPRTGWLKEWSLVLHGTKDPPYRALSPASPHSKLAIVKKAHEDQKMSKES